MPAVAKIGPDPIFFVIKLVPDLAFVAPGDVNGNASHGGYVYGSHLKKNRKLDPDPELIPIPILLRVKTTAMPVMKEMDPESTFFRKLNQDPNRYWIRIHWH